MDPSGVGPKTFQDAGDEVCWGRLEVGCMKSRSNPESSSIYERVSPRIFFCLGVLNIVMRQVDRLAMSVEDGGCLPGWVG